MAYGELYRFVFDAANGPEVTISVAKKDYIGEVYRRAVGGSATLRRERSGCILGSSLEWSAECLSEDEYAELYTSDPTLYCVSLLFSGTEVWRGFVTPELYSSPWVDAPYDVTLTATDNLAELKNSTFKATGDIQVEWLIRDLLEITRLSIPSSQDMEVAYISSMKGDRKHLSSLTVNVDHLAGETCYDVLNSVLESLHAVLYLDYAAESWVVMRETDVSGANVGFLTFGKLDGLSDLAANGSLAMEIVPARKELTVSEEILAANVAKAFNSSNVHTTGGTPKWEESDYGAAVRLTTVPPSHLSGTPESIDSVAGQLFTSLAAGRRYTLTFKARNTGFFVGKTLLQWGLIIFDQNGSVSRTLYFDTNGGYSASYPGSDYPNDTELTPEIAEYSFSFVIPQKVGAAGFTPSRGSFCARCMRKGDGSSVWTADAWLADVRLQMADFPDGLSTRVILDNDARTEADGVALEFGNDMASGRQNVIRETKFISGAIVTEQDFNAFMAIDNALSVALPRLRLSGVMFFKKPTWRLPKFVRTTHVSADNLDYIVEEYNFNLVTGDIDISMLSLPAVSLSYTELTTSNVYGQSSGGSGGSSSGPGGPGGSGGSGAPGAAAGFDTPEATATAVDGTTPTAKVTASGPDTAKKFSFVFGIPKATKVTDADARLQTRPTLRMWRGIPKEQLDVNKIIVSHPLLTSSPYEVVLMRYRRYNRTKRGEDSHGDKLFIARKGWFVALGDKRITDHSAFTVVSSDNNGMAVVQVSELRDFIVKRFMTDSNHTQAELFGRTYAQWQAESNEQRGFGSNKAARQRFGIAVRYANPAFTALLDSGKSLGNTTMEINGVPRYLYSDVAPIDVRLFSQGDKKKYAMWFGLVY